MTYYKRHIDEKLLEWKEGSRRKPLLIRGARQVGKSTAVRELGRTFKYYVEINLERQPSLKALFTEDIDVKKTCSNLSATLAIPIIPGIKPMAKLSQLTVVPKTFHCDIPEPLAREVVKCKSDEDARQLGIEWTTQQCRELYQHGVQNIHFYTVSAVDSVVEVVKKL